jgi:hypothetical protein
VQQPITFAIAEEDGVSNQDLLLHATNTLPGTLQIPVAELKKISAYKLLQLPEGTAIVSFMFTTNNEAGEILEIANYGSEFNNRIRELINAAKPGRIITIDNIRAKKDGQEKKMLPKVYTVIDQ